MPSLRYWKRRKVKDAFRLFQEAEEVANELGKAYFQASNYISKQAEEIFDRFRQKWGLSEQDALDLINTMRDKASIDELMERLQANPGTEERQRLKMELESAAFQARINRLRELHKNLDRIMAQIYRNELQTDTDFFRRAARESFNRYMYELQQRINAGFGFGEISQDVIEKILASDWSGENYSSRIWKNTRKLAETLKESLLVQLITGSPLHEVIKKIAEKFGVAYRWARRLLLTETSHVLNEVDAHARDELGVEKYMYLATLDLRTSKICRSLDGKIFKTSDRQVGKNFPPMHPHCRSTTIDYLGEEWIKKQTRIARDQETGRNYKVPLSMTYEEWYEKYVKGHEEEIWEREKKDRNKNLDEALFKKYKAIFGDEIPDTFEEFQNLKYNNLEEWARLKAEKQPRINAMDAEEVKKLNGMLGDREARSWYLAHDKKILELIDKTGSIESQARQAHAMRNDNRTQARDLMKNQEKRKELDITDPNKTFEKTLEDKMQRKHLTREEAIKDTLATATKTRKSVNKSLGLE